MNLKKAYNLIAKDWNEDHKNDIWWIDGTNKFISFLKARDLILDVGCGAGTKSKYLMTKGFNVIGIDISEKIIDIAKREIPEGKFLVMDMQKIDELTENFNGIFMQASLLHIKKTSVQEVLQKLLRKLKKGGHIYIAVKEKQLDKPEEEIKKEEDYGYPYERFFSYFTLDEIVEHAEKLKTKIVYKNVTLYGNTRWIQVIAKK